MKESVAIAKEANRKKESSPTRSDNSIQRLRNEPERQLGSLRDVIGNIRRNGGTPSVESIATELSVMPYSNRASALLALQQTHGNHYVQRVVTGIQAKLKVGQLDDKYEQEADRVAEQVMNMPEPQVQRQIEPEDEETLWTKGVPSQIPGVTPNLESRIQSLKGSGQPLPEADRGFMERRFGVDFSGVRVHTDSEADQLNKELNAQAFTYGKDIYFGAGRYSPGTLSGKRLLAHELTHVVQRTDTTAKVQRQWIPDTGWRYTPPVSVARSIVEIQAIVGTKPDGIYGPNTREFVKKYQEKLKARGLYDKSIDGKWGRFTEAGHVEFATGNEAETYNCAGLAFKTFRFHSMSETESILSGMTRLSSCSDKCNPYQHKFWYWKYDVSLTDLNTGATTRTHRDFHIVGGQNDKNGEGPSVVVSKNGRRPVKGPAPPASWFPVSGPAHRNDHTDAIVPGVWKNRTNHVETCYCADNLP